MKKRYYMVLRTGGHLDCLVCPEAEIDTLKEFMDIVIVGEGATKQEALRDMKHRN
jgi:hypothetical protein